MTEETCAHEGCTCKAGENGYCSDYCASHGDHKAGDTSAHECACGHSDCEHAVAGE